MVDKPTVEDVRAYVSDMGSVAPEQIDRIVDLAMDDSNPFAWIDEHVKSVEPAEDSEGTSAEEADTEDVSGDEREAEALKQSSDSAGADARNPPGMPVLPGAIPQNRKAKGAKETGKATTRKTKRKASKETDLKASKGPASASSGETKTGSSETQERETPPPNLPEDMPKEQRVAILTEYRRSLPKRARLRLDIHARDLQSGARCPFFEDCPGELFIYSSDVTELQRGEDVVERTIRNFKCDTCNHRPQNPAVHDAYPKEQERKMRRDQKRERRRANAKK